MEIDPIYLLQLTVNGITLGLLYALIAVGLALIFGVLEIVNFAHGEFLMAGAFAMAFALPATGLAYWPSLFVAVVVTAVGGLILFELFLSRLHHGAFERSILITLTLSIIILHAAQFAFSDGVSISRRIACCTSTKMRSATLRIHLPPKDHSAH